MSKQSAFRMLSFGGALALILAIVIPASAAMVDEDFNTVLGTGGGIFLIGSGFSSTDGWDDGITGENAFGGTAAHAHVTMEAFGDAIGGVGGSGAGVLNVYGLNFNMMDENFDSVTGIGGGAFLIGDGVTPNLEGGSADWDGGIGGETAFFAAIEGAILGGDVSAQGLPGTDGAGQMVVNNVDITTGSWYGGLSWQIPGFPAGSAAVLVNGGFDADGASAPFDADFTPQGWSIGGDGYWLADELGWTGNVYTEANEAPPLSSPAVLKMWHAWWTGAPNTTYVYQDLPAQEGQTWQLHCYTHKFASDALTADNHAEMWIEFFDASGASLDSITAIVLDSTSPTGVWIDNTPIQLAAPAGTVTARGSMVFVDTDPASGGGAAYFDNATFDVIAGPPAFDLGQFSLSADVRGEADTGAGEVYGHYQLRLEDSDGNRLVFQSPAVADGDWTSIGGTLDTAVEMDSDGIEASGVFDPGSTTFTVVVAYDNQRTPEWGTGGTLEVDNLYMPNENQAGSDYYGGLFFDNLPVPVTEDPRELTLTADVLGNVVGGNYQLRLEGFSHVLNVDEDFTDATGTGGAQLVYPGGEVGDTTNWDDGIDGPGAFGGVINGIVTEPNGGIWVQGTATEGNPDGGAILEAHEIALGSEGIWYVGLSWTDQKLPSTDLASVVLSVDIKGTWNSYLLEDPSHYILRIEDPQGDWIGFEGTVDGAWHTIGGPLSSAPASGDTGAGDGTFNIDVDSSYTVVVVMESDSTNDWGGTLYVDDVFLTPSSEPLKVERGRITFHGTADGNFQSVGGLLTTGESTWPEVGGYIQDGNADWDRGIEGEAGFFGGYLASIDSVYMQGCPDCGYSGTGGGQFIASGIYHEGANSVYWAGAAWHNVPVDLTDLTKVRLTGDLKGDWDTSGGGVEGKVVLRVEDGNNNRLYFIIDADGAWHSTGGTLDTALVSMDNPPFNQSLDSYSFVVIIYTNDVNEGPNATISFDNLRVEYDDAINGWTDVMFEDFETVTGPTPGYLNDAGVLDSVTLTLTLENGVETWGEVGSSCPGDLNGDGSVTLADLATLLGNYGETSGMTPDDGDMDGDGDIDLSDLAALLGVYGDVCVGGASLTLDNLFFEVAP